jgi:putative ABC transport system substrate-binding protein
MVISILQSLVGGRIRRREVLTLIVGAVVALPRAAQAQHARRIGVLVGVGDDSEGQSLLSAFRQKLQELGWADGRDVEIDLRWGSANINYIRASAAELADAKPDVIFVYSVRVLNAIRAVTHQIPVVFVATSDPVGLGIVAGLAHPGGNLTGFMLYEASVAGKLVELLKEIKPDLERAALLFNPDNLSAAGYWRAIEKAAGTVWVVPVSLPVRSSADIRDAIEEFAREPNGGLLLPPDVTTDLHRDLIIELAAKHRLPAIYSFGGAARGGLISYGPDIAELFRRAALYVHRILKGEKPADLPVQAPEKFALAVNLKAAKAMNIAMPTSILLRADEVIE